MDFRDAPGLGDLAAVRDGNYLAMSTIAGGRLRHVLR